MTIKQLIAYYARVSNPENREMPPEDDKLVDYLMKHGHISPFEMVSFCLFIDGTARDVSHQFLRHSELRVQEFSQRYAIVYDDPIVREARWADPKNRQNSFDIKEGNVIAETWEALQRKGNKQAQDHYTWAITNGIAKECARVVLPEGNTSTSLFAHGYLRSWIFYIQNRTHESAQKEHQYLAYLCAKAISDIYPEIMNHVSPKCAERFQAGF
jgi:thymidylate synthase (FAD)